MGVLVLARPPQVQVCITLASESAPFRFVRNPTGREIPLPVKNCFSDEALSTGLGQAPWPEN
jgi:hypothetical protein